MVRSAHWFMTSWLVYWEVCIYGLGIAWVPPPDASSCRRAIHGIPRPKMHFYVNWNERLLVKNCPLQRCRDGLIGCEKFLPGPTWLLLSKPSPPFSPSQLVENNQCVFYYKLSRQNPSHVTVSRSRDAFSKHFMRSMILYTLYCNIMVAEIDFALPMPPVSRPRIL